MGGLRLRVTGVRALGLGFKGLGFFRLKGLKGLSGFSKGFSRCEHVFRQAGFVGGLVRVLCELSRDSRKIIYRIFMKCLQVFCIV